MSTHTGTTTVYTHMMQYPKYEIGWRNIMYVRQLVVEWAMWHGLPGLVFVLVWAIMS